MKGSVPWDCLLLQTLVHKALRPPICLMDQLLPWLLRFDGLLEWYTEPRKTAYLLLDKGYNSETVKLKSCMGQSVGWKGTEHLCPPWVHHPPSNSLWPLTQKLCAPCHLEFFTDVLLRGSNWSNHWSLLINKYTALLPSQPSNHILVFLATTSRCYLGMTHCSRVLTRSLFPPTSMPKTLWQFWFVMKIGFSLQIIWPVPGITSPSRGDSPPCVCILTSTWNWFIFYPFTREQLSLNWSYPLQ